MDVGVVKVAEDQDFEKLKQLIDDHTGWKLEYDKPPTKIWTKSVPKTNFKMIKICTVFTDVSPYQMYDVLHDPEYRKVWDQHMIESQDIGCLNPNNDIGYYAMSCPAPLKNRDFVLQRSWLDTGREQYIINHSVYHRDFPPRRGFIRATSHITGFLIRPYGKSGCELGYVSQSDPQGTLPPWIVNKVTQIFAPKVNVDKNCFDIDCSSIGGSFKLEKKLCREQYLPFASKLCGTLNPENLTMVKKLLKASLAYPEWKKQNKPHWKPWHYPEQMTAPRISVHDCVQSDSIIQETESLDEHTYGVTEDEVYNGRE